MRVSCLKAGTQIGTGISIAVAALIAFASIFAAMSSQPQASSISTGTDIGSSEKPDVPAPVAAENKPVPPAQKETPKKEKVQLLQWTEEPVTETTELYSGVTTLDYQRIDRHAFAMVNEQREKLGLAPLRWDFDLAGVAGRHSTDMVTNNYFAHADSLGFDVADRYRLEEISCSFQVTNKNAEGIYKSSRSVLEMTEAQIAAMMVGGWSEYALENPDAERMGAGFAIDSEGRLFSTINLC